jgi:hypothetical protein
MKISAIILLVALVEFAALGAVAQDGEAPSGVVIRTKVVRSNNIVSSPFHIYMELTNTTDRVLAIDSINVITPIELEYYYSSTYPSASMELKAHSKTTIVLTYKAKPEGKEHLSLEKIIFLPGEYEFSIVISYSDLQVGSELAKNPNNPTHSQMISFKPPLSSLLVGGIIGAMLLAIFMMIFKARKHRVNRDTIKRVPSGLFRLLILFFFGSIVSVITILLIQRLSDFKLPISLKVEDYLGGIIIGMLSLKLGDSLYELFVKSSDDGEPADAAQV